jgi:hypothetical protein
MNDYIRGVSDPGSLKKYWEKVFRSTDPFGNPYVDQIKHLVLWYPTTYHLSALQYEALMGALKDIGESEFILSVTEDKDCFGRFEDTPYYVSYLNYICHSPTYEAYKNTPTILENSMYSKTGRWGVMISHEFHAVLGGDEAFIASLKTRYPNWRDDFQRLKSDWLNNRDQFGDPAWLAKLEPQLE